MDWSTPAACLPKPSAPPSPQLLRHRLPMQFANRGACGQGRLCAVETNERAEQRWRKEACRGQRPTVRLLLPQLCDWAVSLFLLFLFQFARVSLFFFISNDFPLILD